MHLDLFLRIGSTIDPDDFPQIINKVCKKQWGANNDTVNHITNNTNKKSCKQNKNLCNNIYHIHV